jgi:hypothetical protein
MRIVVYSPALEYAKAISPILARPKAGNTLIGLTNDVGLAQTVLMNLSLTHLLGSVPTLKATPALAIQPQKVSSVTRTLTWLEDIGLEINGLINIPIKTPLRRVLPFAMASVIARALLSRTVNANSLLSYFLQLAVRFHLSSTGTNQ